MAKHSTGRGKRQGVISVRDSRGYVVAGVRPDGTLQKDISGSRHILKKPLAIAFDVAALASAEALGATVAEVTDIETGRVYSAPIATIRRDGVRVDRGFGAQLALPLRQWRTEGGQPPTEPPTEQLGLWAF